MEKDLSLCMGCMNIKNYDGPCRLCGYSDNDPSIPTYLTPKTFLKSGRYIVGRLLSYNGEGATYIGYDCEADCKVTIKEYMPDTLCTRKKGETEVTVNANNSPLYKTYMSEFADLNKTLMKLRGMAHIQAVLDTFYENNTCYAVYEFINGISLKTYLDNSSGGLTWDQVKDMFPPILTAISMVHEQGVIHRGISPQTIFVTDKMELILSGFAIPAARVTNTEVTCEMFSGYAAPEQYTNEINGTWTDVYGIAAVLYKVLTGSTPIESVDGRRAGMPEPMIINRGVPQHVSAVIMKGMKLSTETREQSIRGFVDQLFAPPKYVPSAPQHGKKVKQAVTREEKKIIRQQKERYKFLAILVMIGVLLIAFAIAFALTLSGACVPPSQEGEGSSTLSSVPASSSAPQSSGGSQSSASSSTTSDASQPSDSLQPSVPVESSALIDKPTIELPDFTNWRYEDAVSRFEGMLTFVPTYDYSNEIGLGLMFDQSIEEGKVVESGTQIKVKVSKGRSLVPLPDFAGVSKDQYVATLTQLNIKYAVDTEKTNDVPDGEISRCSKDVGDLVDVENGETITVYVAENFEPEPEPESEPLSDFETVSTELPIYDLNGNRIFNNNRDAEESEE